MNRLENKSYFIRCQEWNDAEIELVKHGDLIRLEHILTRRNIHSHQEPAPLSKKQFQVLNYYISSILKSFKLKSMNTVYSCYYIVM